MVKTFLPQKQVVVIRWQILVKKIAWEKIVRTSSLLQMASLLTFTDYVIKKYDRITEKINARTAEKVSRAVGSNPDFFSQNTSMFSSVLFFSCDGTLLEQTNGFIGAKHIFLIQLECELVRVCLSRSIC